MEKEFYSKREITYRDEAEGDLVYESEFGTTIERTADRAIIKVYADKCQNWMQTADDLWCEVLLISKWLWEEMRAGKRDYADLPAMERDKAREEYRDKQYMSGTDPFLYAYFHSDYNWVIYESDEQYLFLYELPAKESYPLAIRGQIEALRFWAKDDVGVITSFLRSWYERVNGYSEELENV